MAEKKTNITAHTVSKYFPALTIHHCSNVNALNVIAHSLLSVPPNLVKTDGCSFD